MRVKKALIECAAGQPHMDGGLVVDAVWADIEAELRLFDRELHPYVWLYLDPGAKDGDLPELPREDESQALR